jgi:ribosomal protein L11 methylase PrmA
MSRKDVRLSQLSQIYIDGIPLDLTSSLLPKKTYLSYKLFVHIHLHARLQQSHGNNTPSVKKMNFSRQAFMALVNNLEKTILELKWAPTKTEWGSYYKATNYSSRSIKHKSKLIEDYLKVVSPKSVWDIGGNTGLFSRIASNKGIPTISFDIDPVAIEKNYRECVKNQEKNLLPLFLDLTNPIPNIGWANKERLSLMRRGPTDTILALALIHHLAISNNVPLNMIADFFHKLSRTLVVEWIPKSDSNVKRLLTTREDVFPDYTQAGFEKAFQLYFNILQKNPIKGSERTLYLMEASN